MSAPTRPQQREPIGDCPICGEPASGCVTETEKIDVPPFSPDSPRQWITAIPGPSYRTWQPCGHREDL